jgi:hypothetical protein
MRTCTRVAMLALPVMGRGNLLPHALLNHRRQQRWTRFRRMQNPVDSCITLRSTSRVNKNGRHTRERYVVSIIHENLVLLSIFDDFLAYHSLITQELNNGHIEEKHKLSKIKWIREDWN